MPDEKPDRTILVVDISNDLLAIARATQPDEMAARSGIFQTSAFATDLDAKAVDGVFCIRFLHHVESAEHRLAILCEFDRASRDTAAVPLWVDGHYQFLPANPRKATGRSAWDAEVMRGGFPIGKAACRRALVSGLLVVLAAGGFFAWQRFAPVTVADGWAYRVHEDAATRVSALALGADADLYYSEELRDRRGRIVRRVADGSRHEVLAGLSKPDGLLAWRGGIAISQEQDEFPVYWLYNERITALFTGRNVEGLSTDGRHLYAIEDVKENGRLLRYDPDSGELAVLRSGLIEGEGIAVCPDGGIFYSEKGRNRILRLQADGQDRVILQNLNKPSFLFCDGEGLWITEDATHNARLILLGADGGLRVIVRGLRAAQTFLPLGNGRFLLADQGRNRILELERLPR